ncbi:probable palmitoyltransferase ZDHHC24 [Aricia agestis]|uniref:probable palmitoyltransferase ZDHHC24 n=1 Tax=Aricia agestis TaxID=91739 RepID=UPI001C208E51|nr:probable palmitoyltransferase ZDHHC24 [Aricia agestis]
MKKEFRRFLEHGTYMTIILVLIPGFVYFELCVVLPNVSEAWSLSYFVHYFCAIFLLQNIIGNMIYGMFTNTSIKEKYLEPDIKSNWTLCSVCECLRPPRAWHCNSCDICILKRDHHCTFFACCIGYFNHRYFMYFTLYIFIAMVYAFYYNVIYMSQFVKWNHGLIILKCIFPLLSFVIDFGNESFYIMVIDINVIVGAFTGFLFIYHFNNLSQGKVTPERKVNNNDSYDMGWKRNLVEVFGCRWYWTWVSPFIKSPLPGNGIKWDNEHKNE